MNYFYFTWLFDVHLLFTTIHIYKENIQKISNLKLLKRASIKIVSNPNR